MRVNIKAEPGEHIISFATTVDYLTTKIEELNQYGREANGRLKIYCDKIYFNDTLLHGKTPIDIVDNYHKDREKYLENRARR